MSCGQLHRAGAAHGPADDAPVLGLRADAEVRDQVRHHLFGQVDRRIAVTAVDALGVVVERTGGVREDEHRRRTAVGRRVVVDRGLRVAGPDPVRRGVQLRADHHDRRQLRRRIAGEPGRRQVDEFGAVREIGFLRAGRDGYHDTARRPDAFELHGRHRPAVHLVGHLADGELVPRHVRGREVPDPHIHHQQRTERAQGHREHGRPAAPPAGSVPAENQDRNSEPAERRPDPQPYRGRVAGDAQRGDVPVQPGRARDADRECPRQAADAPLARPSSDRAAQGRESQQLDQKRQPPMRQRRMGDKRGHADPPGTTSS